MKKGLTTKISYKEEKAHIPNSGGTSSSTFAVGGGTSYSHHLPTWVFALFALMTHP